MIEHTLYSIVQKTALERPTEYCISFYERNITYREFLQYVDTFAHYLRGIGIGAGDCVTVCIPNSPSAAICLYAINKIGAISHLVHPYSPKRQIVEDLRKTNSKLVIGYDVYTVKHGSINDIGVPVLISNTSHFMPFAAKAVFRLSNTCIRYGSFDILEKHFYGQYQDFDYYRFAKDEAAVYLPSGGTTNVPKIIKHSCYALNKLVEHAQYYLSEDIPYYKATYSVLPIFHAYGLCMNLHICMVHGVLNVMSVKFDAKRMSKAIEKYKVAYLAGVPAMYIKLINSKRFNRANLSSLRECFVGGDSVSNGVIQQFGSILSKSGSKGGLLCGYGMTETSSVVSVNRIKHNKVDSIGYPLPFVSCIIAKDGVKLPAGEVGEILVNTQSIMLGYLENGEYPFVEIDGATYLATGDCGYMDKDGFLYFKQRIKNILKINGVPVYPSEIETVVDSIQGVVCSCAIGIADALRGSVVKLIVEVAEGVDRARLETTIRQQLKKKVIIYASPRKIVFVDNLPRNQIGKVDRKLIEEKYKS